MTNATSPPNGGNASLWAGMATVQLPHERPRAPAPAAPGPAPAPPAPRQLSPAEDRGDLPSSWATFPVVLVPKNGKLEKVPTCKWGKGINPETGRPFLGKEEHLTTPRGTHVGVATGARSGVVVVDLDRKPEPGKPDGFVEFARLAGVELPRGMPIQEVLGALVRAKKLPPTFVAQTMNGGCHLYFADPGGIKNSAGEVAPGIDVRGERGYVVAPPSPGYTWIVPPAPGVDPAHVPGWLLPLLREANKGG